jgi:hypothetical protein
LSRTSQPIAQCAIYLDIGESITTNQNRINRIDVPHQCRMQRMKRLDQELVELETARN